MESHGKDIFFQRFKALKNSIIQPPFHHLEKYDFEYFSKKLPLKNLQVLATKSSVATSLRVLNRLMQ